MEKIKPRTLSGFMELLPDKQAQMEKIQEILRRTFSLYGFAPLDTPLIEAAEVLLAKGGGETEKQVYRFTKGDTDLCLRFDLTVPLAKYVALNFSRLNFPFRRYQIGKVYRGERSQRGRFREFYQADIDIIGDGKLDIISEAEIPAVIYRTFRELGLERFKIGINNRKMLSGFFDMQGLSEHADAILRTIDKLDKIGAEKCSAVLIEDGLSEKAAAELMRFISIEGETVEKLEALTKYEGKNETYDLGLSEMRAVLSYLPGFGVPEDYFELDLKIARGLDYYTGTVYETTLLDHPEIGSICSGGRYDDLASHYIDRKLPGVGISIGLTRLFYILEEQDMLSKDILTAPADVLIIPLSDDYRSKAIETATEFRAAGVRVQLCTEDRKFKAKMNYADKLGVPFAAFIGEDEVKEGVISLKNMRSGDQFKAKAKAAAAMIKEALRPATETRVIRETKEREI